VEVNGQLHALAALLLWIRLPVIIEKEAEWALRRTERIESYSGCPARSLVALQNEMSQLIEIPNNHFSVFCLFYLRSLDTGG
jgi:hypothetical protein